MVIQLDGRQEEAYMNLAGIYASGLSGIADRDKA